MNIAIVQARLTSNRFPRKVLLRIGEYTVISLQYERLKRASSIDRIIYAIPDNTTNDDLAAYLDDQKIECYRGSESNVLSRYLEIFKITKPLNVFRITADCPFVDPGLVDSSFVEHRQGHHDYTKLGSTFADGLGVEIISKKGIQFLESSYTTEYDREHVTTAIKRNSEHLSLHVIENEKDDFSLRYTLDHFEDYLVIQKIYEHFSQKIVDVTHLEIATLLRSNREMRLLNSIYSRNHG